MTEIFNASRRGFLKTGALAGGGLILGVHLPQLANQAEAKQEKAKVFAPNAFVRVGSDDTVTVIVNHSEMGQGVYTGLPMLVAEELDADWGKVRAESAPVDAAYNHPVFGIQLTGGSTSTLAEWDRLRHAGAAARAMLVVAASQEWKVEPADCRTDNGQVLHPPSGRKLTYGQLAERASKLVPPVKVRLKDPKDFKLIGKATRRLDTPEKTNGSAVFGLDVKLPGMLVAVIARPPVFGGKVKSFDATKAKAVPGVKHVVEIDRGVAVVAEGFWPASQGRKALEVAWDDGPLAGLDSRTQGEQYAELAKKAGLVARTAGKAAEVLGKAKEGTLEAVYEFPYLAHAPMEPLNCVADVRADGCEVWTGTQSQSIDCLAAAKAAGLKPNQVKLHTTLLGGGFGRRAVLDSHFVVEAVQVSKAVKAPVKVMWTREDDIRGGYYRPRSYHVVRGKIDMGGSPAAYWHRIVSQSFIAGTPFEAFLFKDGIDPTAVEGVAELPYDVGNIHVEWVKAPGGVPTLWWRSVGHSHNAFVTETFIDELAAMAKADPFEYRRDLLKKHERNLGVLKLAAAKAGWGKPLPAGQARGIAVHESFGSYVAQVAEVSIPEEGRVKVHRVVCAVDCGPVVNPDGVRAQMEGAVAFGLTGALHGEITFEKGRVKQRNFHDYPVLRMDEMPAVEVHIVPSTGKMGGVGETGVPPVAPAVANALAVLTGKRIRRLPFRPEDLKRG